MQLIKYFFEDNILKPLTQNTVFEKTLKLNLIIYKKKLIIKIN